MAFKVNDDLNRIIFSGFNKIHFFGSLALAGILAYLATIVLINFMSIYWAAALAWYIGFAAAHEAGIIWDIGDGFKPWFTKGAGKPIIIQELFYSDGFSLQDVLIWDLFGSLAGGFMGAIAAIIFI